MSDKLLDRLTDTKVVALRIDGDAWPRSLLSTTTIPVGWIGLIERADGGRRFVPVGEEPKTERGDRLLLVRSRPIAVPLGIDDTRASGGYAVSGSCEVLVRWQPRDDDLAALGRTLLHQDKLSLDGLARAVADGGGTAALQRFVRERSAWKLVHEDLASEFLTDLRQHLKQFLFSTGATLERVTALKLSSASLARQEALERETAANVARIEAREMVQQASLAATNRRLDNLGGVLDKLKAAAAGDEHTQWHDLLPTLSPAERGRLLENLWRITPDRHTAVSIVAVAGNECLWLDPASPERIIKRITLDSDLGGLRSVAYCPQENWLLIGAASGVWALDAETGETRGRFQVPNVQPRTGFNSATVSGDRLYATHSQLGCWSWSLEDPASAKCILEPTDGVPRTVRAATATDAGHLVFAADRRVHVYDPSADTLSTLGEADDVICALAAIEDTLFAGTADGRILRRSLDESGSWTLVHRGRDAIESIHARRWNDLIELVVPAGADGISGVYGEEQIVARLLDAPTPIRRAWACDDVVVGLSDQRDRLIVLNANLPERSGREAPIARQVGHSVQDACIVVSYEQSEPQAQARGPRASDAGDET